MSWIVRLIPVVCIVIGTSLTALAQEEWEEGGEIQSVEIEIVKEKQITLPRADRNFEKIPPRPADPLRPTFNYEFKSMKYTAPELRLDVRPLRVKQEELSKIYSGYVSLGYGNYRSPYLEGSITSKRDAQKFYGGEFYHKSYGTGPIGKELSASGDTRLNGFVKGMGTKLTTQAALRYENRFNHYYASTGAPVETRRPEDILQSFNVVALDAGIENTKAADINFKLTGGFSYLDDRYSASESKASLSFYSDYKLKNERLITFGTNYKLIARKDNLTEAKPRHLLTISPTYRLPFKKRAVVDVGVNVVVENDTIGPGSFHLYPNLSMNVVANKNMDMYVGMSGNFEEVSLHRLSAENPWVAPNIPLFHTQKDIAFTFGAKGKLARIVSLDVGSEVALISSLYFYDNVPADRTKFTAVYSDGQRLNFYVQAGLAKGEKIQINARGDIYNYSVDIGYPWHRPLYKVGMYSSWMIAGKLMTDASLVTQGGARAFDHTLNTVVELQPAVDVNLKLRYFWSKRLSLFADGSNLLNKKYPLYLNYPSRGLQVTVGASYCF